MLVEGVYPACANAPSRGMGPGIRRDDASNNVPDFLQLTGMGSLWRRYYTPGRLSH